MEAENIREAIMKIKGLLMGMVAFLGFALAGCSDDVIEGMENQEVQVDNTPAYLTVSFSTAGTSSRSTADDANNYGDQDGSAEDSGHSNSGKPEENTVSDALVVVVPETGNTALAKLFAIKSTEKEENKFDVGIVDEFTATNDPAGTKIYSTANPIALSVGKYRVLVIANPPTVLTDMAFGSNSSIKEETNVTIVKELYEKILRENFASTDNGKFTGDGTDDLAGNNNFMMANKGEIDTDGTYKASELVELTKANTVDNPAFASIEIERAVAKITFRPTVKNDLVTNGGELEPNIYPVKVVFGNVSAKTVKVTIGNDAKTLNCATWKGQEIFVLKEDTGIKYYRKDESGAYTELEDTAAPSDETDIDYLYDDNQAESAIWYVKLEKYALVNLMKKTNYVRHTINASGLETPFGVLTGSNFLWTPYWDDINAVTFDANGAFEGNPAVNEWFWNTLEAVSADSKKAYDANPTYLYYVDIPSSNDNQGYDSVTGDGEIGDTNSGQHTAANQNLPAIGYTLDYVFENATDIEHQTHGLSTGISFMARIYQKNSETGELEEITGLYRYDGHLFQSIQDMVDAYGDNATDAMKDCVKDETAENLAKANIDKFASNICYYYTTEIKHFDNGNPRVMGNMEFAVMRNNIYSLAVTDVRVIGDPYVDPTPNIPDETDEAYLSVEAKIVPWIVRYHDIEFQ